MTPAPSIPHRLHIVSGKGGTGKTTIAGGLACALATAGRRVLLCEVEGRSGIAELFGTSRLVKDEERRICRTPDGGQVFALSIDAEDALLEYLDTFYHLGLAGRALDRFGAVDFATSIAPGLRDVLLTGKVYEAVGRERKPRRDHSDHSHDHDHDHAYDAVVLDAPPTGRIAQFLNVHEAVAGLARVGPIRDQADSIMAMLRSPTTVVHLVTLLEDMPVTETEEAVAQLRPTRIKVATVIANMVTPNPLDDQVLAAAAAGHRELAVPGLSAAQNQALAVEFALEAARMRQEDTRRDTLRELGLPLAEVSFDPGGIDEGGLFDVAEQLSRQLPGEVA